MKTTVKKQALIIATAEMLVKMSSSSSKFSTNAIAEKAKVTQPLIYHYYNKNKGGIEMLLAEAYQYLLENAPDKAARVRLREELCEASRVPFQLPEVKSELMQAVEETAKDLGIDLSQKEEKSND